MVILICRGQRYVTVTTENWMGGDRLDNKIRNSQAEHSPYHHKKEKQKLVKTNQRNC